MTAHLMQLQTAFQQHVLDSHPTLIDEIGAPGSALAPCDTRPDKFPAQRRLHIYHHAYRARLVDALRDSFGHTARYLGDDWFDADALAYVQAHPSTEPSLNDYGAGFADWYLQRHPQDPDIGELASLDWALRRAFDGPDATPLTLDDLGQIAPDAWEHVGFAVVPTCTRLRLTHNTVALWQALDNNEAPPAAAPLAQPTTLLVWRRGHSPHFRSLGLLEDAALLALQGGAPFAAVCAQMSAQFVDTDVPAQAGALLRRWIDEELLCGLTGAG